MKIKIPLGLTKALGKTAVCLHKAAPEIALSIGIAGVVGTTVLACKQTTKLSRVLEPHKESIKRINDILEDKNNTEYTEKAAIKDKFAVYRRTIWEVTKLYGGVLAGEITSLGLILLSHRTIRMRNASLSVALSSITTAFNEYRNRVKETLGEEADRSFRYGSSKTTTMAFTKEDGSEYEVTAEVVETMPKEDLYMRYFNETTSIQSSKIKAKKSDGSPVYNEYGAEVYIQDVQSDLFFLNNEMDLWNAVKASRKNETVYLNEVLSDLSLDTLDAGQDVGWGPDTTIDFRPEIVMMSDEAGNYTATIVLDFNCEGSVRESAMRKKKKRTVIANAKKVVAE